MTRDLDTLEALLPQTQCGACTYAACKPYAQALLQGDRIDRCLPGGTDTLVQLAKVLNKDPTPYLSSMAQKTQAPKMAWIREEDCIGCTKCIQACPVDAIIGASKQSHTVLQAECTGCGLCFNPCPTNCIEVKTQVAPHYHKPKALSRYLNKTNRRSRASAAELLTISNENSKTLSAKQSYLDTLKTKLKTTDG